MSEKWLNKVPLEIGYYIAGFVDGEGSFNVSLRRKKDYKLNWQIVLSFNVSQKDQVVLSMMKQYLECGIIKTRRHDGLHSYDVTNPTGIVKRVLPFFDRFEFISTSKKINYSIFKKIVYMMYAKKHLNKDGFVQILKLREKLNEGKGRTRKYSMEDVLKEVSPETTRQTPMRFE